MGVVKNPVITALVSLCFLQFSGSSEYDYDDVNDGRAFQVFGVNAGGPHHVDEDGFIFLEDTSNEGQTSDYGKQLDRIGRTAAVDQVLYRTERYSDKDFGYDIPIHEDGNFVIGLRFSEVYFKEAGQKVFDVKLNKKHVIVKNLDIFSQVGFGNALQILVPFQVQKDVTILTVNGQRSEIRNREIRLEFIKGSKDNPKINAFFVIKGLLDDVPSLVDPTTDDDYDEWNPSYYYTFYNSEDDDEKNPWFHRPLYEKYAPVLYSLGLGALLISVMLSVL